MKKNLTRLQLQIKLKNLLSELNKGVIEREPVIRLSLLGLIAGENTLLIGPPGTGKSMLARRLSDCLTKPDNNSDSTHYFEYLLTKFSTPEEIFGPLAISELKKDNFKRNTYSYLPSVQLGFLDEIFKASSSILNSLLTLLNEKIYHNGAEIQQTPLLALIAASNELPLGHSELEALYDRFLIRVFVDYISPENRTAFFKPFDHYYIPDELKFSAEEVIEIRKQAQSIKVPEDVAQSVLTIWNRHKEEFKEDAQEYLSDRRLAKVIQLMKVSAYTNAREQVDYSDVLLLKDCIWNSDRNAETAKDIVVNELHQATKNFKKRS